MGNVTKGKIMVYSHPSYYSGYPDSHTFALCADDRKYCNCGGIYDIEECELVCCGTVYQTWLDKFMPNQTTEFKDTGIYFSSNGVCHSYAMREVLLCDEELDTSSARGDDIAVAYYGKYGTGLSYLKIRLMESFEETRKEEELPSQLLDKILDRISISTNVGYETDAWISTIKMCCDIDVLSYYRDEYDRKFLENRIEYLIYKREALFDQCFDASNRTLSYRFEKLKKQLYKKEFSAYMHDLARYGYFSDENANKFVERFNEVLDSHVNACRRILAEFESCRD